MSSLDAVTLANHFNPQYPPPSNIAPLTKLPSTELSSDASLTCGSGVGVVSSVFPKTSGVGLGEGEGLGVGVGVGVIVGFTIGSTFGFVAGAV